jgi:hypothetical protein
MDTISITFKQGFALENLRQVLTQHWCLLPTRQDQLAIQEDNSRIYFYADPSEKTSCPSQHLLIDYSNVDLVKKVLQTVADSPNCIIDNDFGTILAGNEFVARIKSQEGWNWRDSAIPRKDKP